MARIPRVLVYSPTGLIDPRMVVAATRAGGLGVLDLGPRFESTDVLATVDRISGLVRGRQFGVRIEAQTLDRMGPRDTPSALAVIVVGAVGVLLVFALDRWAAYLDDAHLSAPDKLVAAILIAPATWIAGGLLWLAVVFAIVLITTLRFARTCVVEWKCVQLLDSQLI